LAISGFKVKRFLKEPILFCIKYTDNEHPVICFLKPMTTNLIHKLNAAILTCSSADGACPFIAGAEKELPSPLKTQGF
jgi:arsenate reductase